MLQTTLIVLMLAVLLAIGWLALRVRVLADLEGRLALLLEEKHRAMLRDLHEALDKLGDRLNGISTESAERLRASVAQELTATREAMQALQLSQTNALAETRERIYQTLAEQGKAEQELIQATMRNATMQLTTSIEALTKTVDGRLEQISRQGERAPGRGLQEDQRDLRQRDAAPRHHRRGAEEDRQPHRQRGQPAGTAGRQEIARRVRRSAARGAGAQRHAPGAFEMQYTLSNGSARRLRAETARAHRPGGGRFEVPAGELPSHVRGRRERGGPQPGAKGVPRRHQEARRRDRVEVHHRPRDFRRRGDVRAGGGGVRRDPRLSRRGGGIRQCAPRLDRLADHADGGAQHGARGAEGRGDAQADPRDQGIARAPGGRVRPLRRAHEKARRPYPPGERGRGENPGHRRQDQPAVPAHRGGGTGRHGANSRLAGRFGREVGSEENHMEDESMMIMLIQQYASMFGMTFSSKAMDTEETRLKAMSLMMQAISGSRGPVTDEDLGI